MVPKITVAFTPNLVMLVPPRMQLSRRFCRTGLLPLAILARKDVGNGQTDYLQSGKIVHGAVH
jgi:hypothetical protein